MAESVGGQIKVSVVVPVYNTEAYLARCLDSLVAQTLAEIEIIVVNDGSTDGSQGIIDAYATRYPHVIRAVTQRNEGLSAARNRGMAISRGEFIGFVDSDDYVAADMYARMYECAQAGGFDLVSCDFFFEYEGRARIAKDAAYDSTEAMLVSMYASAWNKLIRRTLLAKGNLCFMLGKLYEDILFACALALWVGRSGHLSVPLYAYVQRASSITYTQKTRVEDIFDILAEVDRIYRAQGQYTQHRAALEYLHARLLLNSSFLRVCRQRDRTRRHALARATLEVLETRYPAWRANPYVRAMKPHHRISMFCMRRGTMVVLADMYRAVLWIQQSVRRMNNA